MAHPPSGNVHTLSLSQAQGGAGVAIHDLGVAFGSNRVLHDLDLAIASGQFVSIVGRSGCGKSTLLRAITGLENPVRGTIETDRGRTRVVFQEPRLLPWSDVRANVEVGAEGSVAERREQADHALALVGLSDKAAEWPARLSGGQKQRVALARALVAHPQILALDEPLGALDALTRIEMQLLLERIWRKQKFTAVLVTHDVSEAVALADRIVVIDEGRIALDLDVKLPRPRRHGTAEFAKLEEQVLNQLFGRGEISG